MGFVSLPDVWRDEDESATYNEERDVTRAVNIRVEECDVYVGRGRGSRWGNSYSHQNVRGTKRVASREEAIRLYKHDLWELIRLEEIAGRTGTLEALAELHGKRLGCWCKPAACHGDVLASAAEWAKGELERRAS